MQVVSGDMLEAYVYLRDVERLIVFHGVDRAYKSKRVRLLHCTFLYLWTLQASVRVFGGKGRSEMHTPLLADSRLGSAAFPRPMQDASIWANLLQPNAHSNAEEIGHADEDYCDAGPEWTSSIFEQVYSIPEKLFQLIGRVTSLARTIEQLDGRSEVSKHHRCGPVAKQIADLETDICDWKNDIPRPESPSAPPHNSTTYHQHRYSQPSSSVLYRFREAVHAALVIYFYRCVRNVDTVTVQPLVEKTIEHLQAYAEAKRESGDNSSSICWPGFIAGCEALDPELRQRMSNWFSQETAQTGIRMFEMAGQAAKYVWDTRDQSRDRNLPWSRILRQNDILDQLVLS